MKEHKIYMNKEDGLLMLIVPQIMGLYLPYLSTGYQGEERLEKILKIHDNALVLNAIMDYAEDDEEAAKEGDQVLVDYLFSQTEYLVTRYQHLLPEDRLAEIEELKKQFAEEADKKRKEAIEEAERLAKGE